MFGLLIVSFVASSSILVLKGDFSDRLYNLLREEYIEQECGTLVAYENIPTLSSRMHPKAFSLIQSVYRYDLFNFELVGQLNRDIKIQVPGGVQEELTDTMYQFSDPNLNFALDISNRMQHSVNTSSWHFKLLFEEKGINYEENWLRQLKDRLVGVSDEGLLRQSLQISFKDIKHTDTVESLYNATLLIARMEVIGSCEQPRVIFDGSRSLYLFPYRSGSRLTVESFLFENEKYVAHALFSLQNTEEKEGQTTVKAATYLKTIFLGTD